MELKSSENLCREVTLKEISDNSPSYRVCTIETVKDNPYLTRTSKDIYYELYSIFMRSKQNGFDYIRIPNRKIQTIGMCSLPTVKRSIRELISWNLIECEVIKNNFRKIKIKENLPKEYYILKKTKPDYKDINFIRKIYTKIKEDLEANGGTIKTKNSVLKIDKTARPIGSKKSKSPNVKKGKIGGQKRAAQLFNRYLPYESKIHDQHSALPHAGKNGKNKGEFMKSKIRLLNSKQKLHFQMLANGQKAPLPSKHPKKKPPVVNKKAQLVIDHWNSKPELVKFNTGNQFTKVYKETVTALNRYLKGALFEKNSKLDIVYPEWMGCPTEFDYSPEKLFKKIDQLVFMINSRDHAPTNKKILKVNLQTFLTGNPFVGGGSKAVPSILLDWCSAPPKPNNPDTFVVEPDDVKFIKDILVEDLDFVLNKQDEKKLVVCAHNFRKFFEKKGWFGEGKNLPTFESAFNRIAIPAFKHSLGDKRFGMNYLTNQNSLNACEEYMEWTKGMV
jgi:hypothetical protein